MSNFFTLQQKAIAQKFDIAKLMAEVVKHGGDVKGAIDASKATPTTLNLDKLREIAMQASSTESETEEYVTKK